MSIELTEPNGKMTAAELADVQARNASQLAMGWNENLPTAGLDHSAKNILTQAQRAIAQSAAAMRSSEEEALRHAGDDRYHPDYRKRKAAETRAAGAQAADDALEEANVYTDLAETALTNASLPPLPDSPREREAVISQAREDIQMVLNGEPDARNLLSRMRQLADRDDAIGRVMTDGSFVELYLMSRGVSDGDRANLTSAIRESALNARAQRGDPNAQAVYLLRKNLRGGIQAARSLRRRNS